MTGESNKELLIGLLTRQIAFHPPTFGGHVITDKIEHQSGGTIELADLLPTTNDRVDLLIIDDRKTIVGRVGIERPANAPEKTCYAGGNLESGEGIKGRFFRLHKLVGVGDKH